MPDDRAWRFALAALLALALAVRWGATAALQGFASPPDRSANPDQLNYEETAWELAQGHGFALGGRPSYFRSPGTSLALLPAYLAAGRSWTAGRLWFGLLSALTCVALAALAADLFGRRTGLAAGAILALDPGHFYYALHFVSEVPYALFLVLSMALFARALAASGATGSGREATRGRRSDLAALAAGLAWGLATLTRTQAAIGLPLAWALWGFARWRSGRREGSGGRSGHTRPLAVATLGAILAIAPWMARNALRFETSELSATAGLTFLGAHNAITFDDPAWCGSWVSVRLLWRDIEPAGERVNAARAWAEGKATARARWRDLPRLEVCKLRRLGAVVLESPNRAAQWSFALAWIAIAPWAAWGLIVAVRRHPLAAAVAALPLLVLLVAALLFYGSIRLRHSTEPVFALLAAAGAASAWNRVRSRRPPPDAALRRAPPPAAGSP